MSYSQRWSLVWIVACLLCAGCGGSAGTVLSPPSTPAPPGVLGRGTLAVIERNDRVLVFPPQSDKVAREFSIASPGSANSLAFDRRGHLYIGITNHEEYFVREVNVQSGDRLRFITVGRSLAGSRIATDDHNVLYANTKAFVGSDVKLFRPEDREKPYLEVKDALTTLTIRVARSSLWVGYYGVASDGLARYDLRSTKQTWFKGVGNYAPVQLAVNPEGSMVATKALQNGKPSVRVYDVKSSKSTQVHAGDTEALASDDSGNLYIAQRSGRILICTFGGCPHSFETNLQITSLAWSAPDEKLYVGSNGTKGKPGVYVYDPRTTSLVRQIPMAKDAIPVGLAIEL